MVQAFIGQIAGVFATPVGALVLLTSILAAIGISIWGFWRRDDASVPPVSHPTDEQVAPPPLLAPSMVTGGSTIMSPNPHYVRNGLLTVLAVAGLFAVWHFAAKDAPANVADRGQEDSVAMAQGRYIDGDADVPREAPVSIPVYTHTDVSRIVCAEGILNDKYPRSYQLCGSRQAAQFDVIGLARGGQPLIDAVWAHSSTHKSAVKAANQPTPFSLDRERVSLVPGAGTDINDYDAFLAVGPFEPVVNEEVGDHLTSQRSFDLARFVLASLRGSKEAECKSGARVRAIAIDKETASENAIQKPILIGVRFDERYPVADRDLDRLVEDFFGSQGARLAGQSLHEMGGYHTVFTETACRGLF